MSGGVADGTGPDTGKDAPVSASRLAELDAALREGLAQLERGEILDGAGWRDRVEAALAARRKAVAGER